MGRPRTCDCGECPKCRRREAARAAYQALSLEERRSLIARRDPEKVRAADRARYFRNRDERQARMRAWAKANPERSRELQKAYLDRYPEKTKARYMVGNAIRDGKLERQPCQECGNPKSHAHHFDYSKPLDVIWLCSLHHGEVHRRYPSSVWSSRSKPPTTEDAKALGANTRRVLGQYFPAGQVSLSVFGRPLDSFCRKVA